MFGTVSRALLLTPANKVAGYATVAVQALQKAQPEQGTDGHGGG